MHLKGSPEGERQTWILRQITFWQLIRWTGMAVADAVNFDVSAVNDNGKFIYHRWKLRKKPLVGTVRVPQHVRELLKVCTPEPDAVSKKQLFRSRDVTLHALTQRWRERFKTLCDVARITEIETGVRGRMQEPHPHALRDTFAVWMLRKTRNVKAVSKMLGHANSIITETTYLPWGKSWRRRIWRSATKR
jgi:integrase